MNVSHKIIDSGYHYVKALDYAHLFAQWPVGTELTIEQVSQGEFKKSDETISNFISAALAAAGESMRKEGR